MCDDNLLGIITEKIEIYEQYLLKNLSLFLVE